jgi:hypothetical protein
MAIDDKDKDRYGSSGGKSPTKFKERPADPKRQTHPENAGAEDSPQTDDEIGQWEGSDELREKVRRTIPKPGHPGKKPQGDIPEKGVSEEQGKDEEHDKESGLQDSEDF